MATKKISSKEQILVKCPMCHGSGKGQPIANGFESAARINEWCMKQTCNNCNGTGKVSEDKNK